ncbi:MULTISPECIES: DUF4124 domain-containing protein [Psychrobacter]|uniref:DUF4124 domain-containing protein n=1 Tax=Psychrobacter TaxID=497 RepID=UPI00146C5DBA|nr:MULTISPECIES: DUF4124 domain-containing protein [Psychrobacter]
MKKFAKWRAYKSVGAVVVLASFSMIAMATPIYKVVDDSGRITFTDNPQHYENQAGKTITPVAVSESTALLNNRTANNQAVSQPAPPQQTNHQNSSQSTAANNAQTSNENSSKTKPQLPSPSYQLTMTEPSAERAYRRPAQNIVVNLQVKPALKSSDSVTIYIDGAAIAQGLSANVPTVDLMPGQHTISAAITNKSGQTISQVSQTVYVIQNTTVLQNNKKIAAQLQAYERLSLPQKILLKLRQDNINQAEAAKKRQTAPNDPFGALIGK